MAQPWGRGLRDVPGLFPVQGRGQQVLRQRVTCHVSLGLGLSWGWSWRGPLPSKPKARLIRRLQGACEAQGFSWMRGLWSLAPRSIWGVGLRGVEPGGLLRATWLGPWGAPEPGLLRWDSGCEAARWGWWCWWMLQCGPFSCTAGTHSCGPHFPRTGSPVLGELRDAGRCSRRGGRPESRRRRCAWAQLWTCSLCRHPGPGGGLQCRWGVGPWRKYAWGPQGGRCRKLQAWPSGSRCAGALGPGLPTGTGAPCGTWWCPCSTPWSPSSACSSCSSSSSWSSLCWACSSSGGSKWDWAP